MRKYGRSSGVERSMAPVSKKLRYTWSEHDRNLIAAGLLDPQGLKVAGVSGGLGSNPDKVYGFSVFRDNQFTVRDDGLHALQKTYCGAFHRSLIGELTVAGVVMGELRRLVSPVRLADWCNKRIWQQQVLQPDDISYYDTKKEKIRPGRMGKCYSFFTRLTIVPHIPKLLETKVYNICVLCGELAGSKCPTCKLATARFGNGAPLESIRQVFETVYNMLPKQYNQITKESRKEALYFLGPELAAQVVPNKNEMIAQISWD